MRNWIVKHFDSKAWDAIKETVNSGEYTQEYSDYFGCAMCGAVCFDFVLRDVGDRDGEEYFLCADPYLLGIDSGYGYTKRGTAYDEYDGFCLDYRLSDDFDTALASFLRQIDAFTDTDATISEYTTKTDPVWTDED